jgi:hypothetical protein
VAGKRGDDRGLEREELANEGAEFREETRHLVPSESAH